jgi:hypothetical protein
MSKLWLKRILQIVGTLGLLALVAIVYRRTDWCKGFTPDGIMTLIAGVLAFAAVQCQMWDQRRTSRQEQDRQNRAVATAILLEIDQVNRLMSDQVHADDFNIRYLIPPNRFVVFEANAGYLGSLGSDLAQAIVRFYGEAGRYFLGSQQHLREIENAKAAAAAKSFGSLEAFGASVGASIEEGNYRSGLTESFRAVNDAAIDACNRLCSFTAFDRSGVYALSRHASAGPEPNAEKN